MNAESSADAITAASGSNLALSFVCLPRDRRRDMNVFYAFCRVVDDIADSAGTPGADKRAALAAWRRRIAGPQAGEPGLAGQVRRLAAKYAIPNDRFLEIIEGMEIDVDPVRFQTFDDLRRYCHLVASVVGLVSIEIFGYSDPACRDYAIQLGYALQMTNIIRDIRTDFANGGRIYLPVEDIDRFGVTAQTIASGIPTPGFRQLVEFEADRASSFYRHARAALPPADRKSMRAAEMMRAVYSRLLDKMRRDGFRVLDRDYRLGRLEKVAVILSVWGASLFWPGPERGGSQPNPG